MSYKPENYPDFIANKDQLSNTHCINCSSPFDDGNTWSVEGWKETQISGICEACFDDMFKYMEEEGDSE